MIDGKVDASPEAVAAMVRRCESEAAHHADAGRPFTASEFRDAAALLSQVATRAEKAEATVAQFEKLMAEIVAAVSPDLKNDIWCGSLAQAVEATAARADTASRQLAEARAALLEMADECRRLNGGASPREAYLTPKARALLSGETTI